MPRSSHGRLPSRGGGFQEDLPPLTGHLFRLLDSHHGGSGNPLGRTRTAGQSKDEQEESSSSLKLPTLSPLRGNKGAHDKKKGKRKPGYLRLMSTEARNLDDSIGMRLSDWRRRWFEFDFGSCQLRYVSSNPELHIGEGKPEDTGRRTLGFVQSTTVVIAGGMIETAELEEQTLKPLTVWTFEVTFYIEKGRTAGEYTVVLGSPDLREREQWIQGIQSVISQKQQLERAYGHFVAKVKEERLQQDRIDDEVRQGVRGITVNTDAQRKARLHNGKVMLDVQRVFNRLSALYVVEAKDRPEHTHTVVRLLDPSELARALEVLGLSVEQDYAVKKLTQVRNTVFGAVKSTDNRVDLMTFEALFKAVFQSLERKEGEQVQEEVNDLVFASKNAFLECLNFDDVTLLFENPDSRDEDTKASCIVEDLKRVGSETDLALICLPPASETWWFSTPSEWNGDEVSETMWDDRAIMIVVCGELAIFVNIEEGKQSAAKEVGLLGRGDVYVLPGISHIPALPVDIRLYTPTPLVAKTGEVKVALFSASAMIRLFAKKHALLRVFSIVVDEQEDKASTAVRMHAEARAGHIKQLQLEEQVHHSMHHHNHHHSQRHPAHRQHDDKGSPNNTKSKLNKQGIELRLSSHKWAETRDGCLLLPSLTQPGSFEDDVFDTG